LLQIGYCVRVPTALLCGSIAPKAAESERAQAYTCVVELGAFAIVFPSSPTAPTMLSRIPPALLGVRGKAADDRRMCRRLCCVQQLTHCNSSGNLAIFAAIRRASSGHVFYLK